MKQKNFEVHDMYDVERIYEDLQEIYNHVEIISINRDSFAVAYL